MYNFNSPNVIDMSYMIYNCNLLSSLNIYNFNSQKVAYMKYMFYNCYSLTSLYLNYFYTQNVLDANFNSYQKILVPIEETEFADMIGEEYTVDFIIDELNAYNDANSYYGENDSQKVSQLIKY